MHTLWCPVRTNLINLRLNLPESWANSTISTYVQATYLAKNGADVLLDTKVAELIDISPAAER